MSGDRPLVLRDALALTPELRRASLLVRGGMIADVLEPAATLPGDAETLDCGRFLLIPGLVNGHTHSHGSLTKGLVGDRWTLETLLNANPALNAGRTARDIYLAAAWSAVELVRRGCTTCFDLAVELPAPTEAGIHAVASAYRDVGLRARFAPMLADRSLLDAIPGLRESLPPRLRTASLPPSEALATCRRVFDAWPFDRSRVAPAIAPTIPLHCSDEFLRGCDRLARDLGLGLQTHLAESRTQAVAGLRRYGTSLTRHLGELGVLGAHVSAAHGIWLDDADMALLAEAGVGVVHNPMSNLRFGSGLAPVRRLRERGVRVALGTDATNTSDSQNMFEAMRWASHLSRIATPEPARWLSVEAVFAMATQEGARLFADMAPIGALARGHAADIVFLDLDDVVYTPLNDPLLQMVNAESGLAVRHVMIGGAWIIRDRRLVTIDEAALAREVDAAAGRLRSINARDRDDAAARAEFISAFCLAQEEAALPIERRLRF